MTKQEFERAGVVAKQLNVPGTQMREAVDAVDRSLRKSAALGDLFDDAPTRLVRTAMGR